MKIAMLINQSRFVESQDRVEFHGFESLYKQILDIEDHLLCSNVQIEAEEAFDDLKKSFEEFQAKVRAVVFKARRKKNQNLRQMTIHDMFHWKMLIPKNFVIKCLLNRDAYLNGCILKWEATVHGPKLEMPRWKIWGKVQTGRKRISSVLLYWLH